MNGENLKEKSTEELFELYRGTGNLAFKQEIVLRYVDMVRTIAVKLRGVYISFAEVEDIVNEGVITLMSAIDRFDVSKNVKFESYASLRIRGTIVDLARKQDWVPRSVRKMGKELDNAYQELYMALDRHPEDVEIAEKMGISIEKYHKLQRDMNLLNIMSLEALIQGFGDDEKQGDKILKDETIDASPEALLENQELKDILKNAIEKLKEKERLVVSLYYEKELNMRDIAQVLELSEPRVSQIHSSAIQKVKTEVESYYML